jgi:signal transduction histidine kinase
MRIVARVARHEVGDLLQTIYATVALLQERLPANLALEKRLLGDLRWRAETCKNEFDAIHDLICPLSIDVTPVDLAEVLAALVGTFSRRYTDLAFNVESVPVAVVADARRLVQACHLLLTALCQSASRQVRLKTYSDAREKMGALVIEEESGAAMEEQFQWQQSPFRTTRAALGGLGLALAEDLALLQGGRLEAYNPPEGGFRVRILLPLAPGGER